MLDSGAIDVKTAQSGSKYKLIEIANFDARHGAVRCSIPGIGASQVGRRGTATANFWVDSYDQFVVRITCGKDIPLNFVATVGDRSGPIKGQELQDFSEYMNAVLLGWLTRGCKMAAKMVTADLQQAFKDGALKLREKLDKSYLWENDPQLVPKTYQRQKNIQLAVFQTHKRIGTPAEATFFKNDKTRAEYAAWLKQQD